MSSYPPPPPSGSPPSPFGVGGGPGWDRRTWKAQQRAAAEQARWTAREQRRQIRQMGRHSLAGPLFLVALGILFLLVELGRLPAILLAQWYGRWWPAILVLLGLILLAEWAWDERRAATGAVPVPRRTLGGLGIFVAIVVAITGSATMAANRGRDWAERHVGTHYGGLDRVLGRSASSTSEMSTPLASGGSLTIDNPHGEIDVTGSSTDGQVHVSAKRQVHGWDQHELDRRSRSLEPSFGGEENSRTLSVPAVESGSADLTVSAPPNALLTLKGRDGQITVRDMHAPVTVASGEGGVELSEINGSVSVTMSNDDADVVARNILGDVSIDGRSGDLTVSDVSGRVMLHGDFFGTTELERIAGGTHFQTSRTTVDVAGIDGDLRIEGGSDLTATHIVGPVTIVTRDRNLNLDGIAGSLDVQNRNGSVTVNSVAPAAPLHIQNRNGTVDLGLPENIGATLTVTAHNGELTNDFNLNNSGNEDEPTLKAALRGGGPPIVVSTTDGSIHLGRTTATSWTRGSGPQSPQKRNKESEVPASSTLTE